MSETDSMAHFGGKASPPPPPKPLSAGEGAIITLFLDSDLDTRFAMAMAVAADSTISDLKSQVALEHAAAFPDLGPVVVKAFEQEIMKEHKGIMYRLGDSKLKGDILSGKPGRHIMHVKMDRDRGKSSQASIGGADAGARVAVHAHDLHPPVAEASQAPAMAASPLPPKPLSAGGGAIVTLLIKTDLGTNLVLDVAADSTISELKSQVALELDPYLPGLGPVLVKSFQKEVFPQKEVMKGKKKGIMYHLCDSFLRSDVLNSKPGTHDLHVKMAAAGKHSGIDPQRHAQVDAVEAQNGMAPAAAATDMHHAGHPLPRNAPREFVKKTMCEVCKVQLDGPADIPRHISGKKHKKEVKRLDHA